MGKHKIKQRKRRERARRAERAFSVEDYLAGAPVCEMCGRPYDGKGEVCGECAAAFHEQALMEEPCE